MCEEELTTPDPVIFRGLKSITLNDPQTDSILRLAQEGISVYSPHTAVDAVPGGMADWLCDIVTGSMVPQDTPYPAGGGAEDSQPAPEKTGSDLQPQQQQQPPPLPPRRAASTSAVISHTRTTLYPNPSAPPAFEDAGMGRLVTFATPQPLSKLVSHLAWGAGSSSTSTTSSPMKIPLALPQTSSTTDITDISISTVATCPGSGSSILLNKDGVPAADLLITGELSHHAALGAIERGSAVAALFHSNSERGYLERVMRPKLADALRAEWGVVREEMAQALDADSLEMQQLLEDEGVEVAVSAVDRDPYVVVDEAALEIPHYSA